jgi:hypothetical protein
MANPQPKPPAPVTENPAPTPEAPKPQRFDHPGAFAVYILSPYDTFQSNCVKDGLQSEFDFLENPPSIERELRPDQMFPGVIVYVAHLAQVRERNLLTQRFEHTKRIHVSEPIELGKFFGLSRGQGGLDLDALMRKVNSSTLNDPRGEFFICRQTSDRGIKLFNT